jgi:hypothetical protein
MGIHDNPFPAKQSHRKLPQILNGNVIKKDKLVPQRLAVRATENALHGYFNIVGNFRNQHHFLH